MAVTHTLVKGQIGAGSTRLLKEIVDQMRKRDDLVVIASDTNPNNERGA